MTDDAPGRRRARFAYEAEKARMIKEAPPQPKPEPPRNRKKRDARHDIRRHDGDDPKRD